MSLKAILNYLKPPRTLGFTSEGKGLIILIIVLGISAVNTGNNPLYLVVAMLLSFVIISGVLSETSLRGVSIERSFPKHLFAQRTFYIFWSIKNIKRLPSFSIEAKERSEDGLEGGKGYFIKIASKGMVKGSIPYYFKRRGVYNLKGFRISTCFPFGLFVKSKTIEGNHKVIVFPPIRPFETSNIKGTTLSEKVLKMVKGKGESLYNLRDYIPGEDSRTIHWKSSARAFRLLSKEFEREEGKRVAIIFNDTFSQEKGSQFSELFERAVEFTASLVSSLIGSGYSVGLQTSQKNIPCRGGEGHLYRILSLLAIIEPTEAEKKRTIRNRSGQTIRAGRSSSIVVVCPRVTDLKGIKQRRGITFAMDKHFSKLEVSDD